MQGRTRAVARRALVPVAGLLLLASIAPPASGQDPAVPPAVGAIDAGIVIPSPPYSGWTAEMIVGRESYVSDNSVWRPWTHAELLVARRFTGGSIGAGLLAVERFDRRDRALSVDVYRALWDGAHANVRAQVAQEGVVLPPTDISAELYQGVAGGWEPSIGVRRLGYAEPVFLASLTLGKYVGDKWYGRVRGTRAARSGGSSGASASGLVRRYLGSSREFAELAAGAGKEVVTAGVAASDEAVVDIRRTEFVELGGRKYLARHVGVTVAGSFARFEGIPHRLGARAGILARF